MGHLHGTVVWGASAWLGGGMAWPFAASLAPTSVACKVFGSQSLRNWTGLL